MLTEEIIEEIKPIVKSFNKDLWGCELCGGYGSFLLRIYIDSTDPVTLEDCKLVSNQISGVLDSGNFIKGRYTLEVTSPGIDRPLFSIEHFERYKGSDVRVKLSVLRDGKKVYLGKIQSVRQDEIEMILFDGKLITVSIDNIERARLVPKLFKRRVKL